MHFPGVYSVNLYHSYVCSKLNKWVPKLSLLYTNTLHKPSYIYVLAKYMKTYQKEDIFCARVLHSRRLFLARKDILHTKKCVRLYQNCARLYQDGFTWNQMNSDVDTRNIVCI